MDKTTEQPRSELTSQLQEYFPQLSPDEITRFEEHLHQQGIAEERNGYRLNFVGREYARLQAGLSSDTLINPDAEHNTVPKNAASGNVFITGDNLEALRHLQNAYAGKVKMIYIDPPYNTGREFVYKDHFELDDEKLRQTLGYSDDDIKRLRSIQGKSSHSAWLTFMYPRLALAKKLLTDDGVIFVSIDDNEQANLKLLMDDIFGEGNFVAGFVVVRSEGGGLAKQAVIGHDYLLPYAKNIASFTPLGKPKDIRGKIVSVDGEDYWIETDWLRKEFGKYGTCLYEEIVRWHGQSKKDEIDNGLKDGSYILIDRKEGHAVGRYRKVSGDSSKFYTVLKHLNRKGNDDLDSLKLNSIFDFPKPIDLVKELIQGATIWNKNALILDFFAGSSTTAHAVMQLNAEDGGNRKWIMVQWDEPTAENSVARRAGFETIDQISRERIKRAGDKIETQKSPNLFDGEAIIDTGFKHYRLTQPAAKTLDKIETFDPNLGGFEDMITPMGGRETILMTWLIDDGYSFDTKIEDVIFDDYTTHYVGASQTLYLIDRGMTSAALKAILNKIGGGELPVQTIVAYAWSIEFERMRELEIGVKMVDGLTLKKRY